MNSVRRGTPLLAPPSAGNHLRRARVRGCIQGAQRPLLEVFLLLPRPAVSADLVPVDADGLQQAVQGLVAQRVEAQLLADGAEHASAALRGGVGVFLDMLLPLV